MNARTQANNNAPAIANPPNGALLQRKCSCGSFKGPTGECQNCRQQSALDSMQQSPFDRNQVEDHSSQSLRSSTECESHSGHDFSRIPVKLNSLPVIQCKLTVNTPGDIYEQEADRVADQVMRMPEPQVQRQCACGKISTEGECAECKKKNGGAIGSLQRVASSPVGGMTAPPIVNDVLSSPGSQLPTTTRSFMETRFGQDFSHVRVHTDAQAGDSAQAVSARAYTVGHHIAFGPDEHPARDLRLLAHELTHTIQQSDSMLSAEQTTVKVSNVVPTRHYVQRYEGYEHQDLGDRHLDELEQFLTTPEGIEWAKRMKLDANSVGSQIAKDQQDLTKDKVTGRREITLPSGAKLTPGEIIALSGDFYSSFEKLKEGTQHPKSTEKDGKPKDNRSESEKILSVMDRERTGYAGAAEDYEVITNHRYLKMASDNLAHFAPANRDVWRAGHLTAIQKALSDKAALQEAIAMDAFACHFLTDAFSAGHLFDANRVEAMIPVGLRNYHSTDQRIANGILIALLQNKLVLKSIHDILNESGFEIENGMGAKWKTFGDGSLKKSPDTQRIAALAVLESRQDVIRSSRGEPTDIDRVLKYLPNADTQERATQQAIKMIPQAIERLPSLIVGNASIIQTKDMPGGPATAILIEQLVRSMFDPTPVTVDSKHPLAPGGMPYMSFGGSLALRSEGKTLWLQGGIGVSTTSPLGYTPTVGIQAGYATDRLEVGAGIGVQQNDKRLPDLKNLDAELQNLSPTLDFRLLYRF